MIDNSRLSERLQSDPDDRRCVDCDCSPAEWACLYHGTFLCGKCVEQHRELGIFMNFTKSVVSARWTELLIQYMEMGGNTLFRDFIEPYGLSSTDITSKYYSKAAEYYRQRRRSRLYQRTINYSPPSISEGSELFMQPFKRSYSFNYHTSRQRNSNTARQRNSKMPTNWWSNTKSILTENKLVDSIYHGSSFVLTSGSSMVSKVPDIYSIGGYAYGGMNSMYNYLKEKTSTN